jgi:hypothetical protein
MVVLVVMVYLHLLQAHLLLGLAEEEAVETIETVAQVGLEVLVEVVMAVVRQLHQPQGQQILAVEADQ